MCHLRRLSRSFVVGFDRIAPLSMPSGVVALEVALVDEEGALGEVGLAAAAARDVGEDRVWKRMLGTDLSVGLQAQRPQPPYPCLKQRPRT